MTNEELDQARAEEAFEQSKAGDLFTDIAAYAARLAREGWTPPVPVDPDLNMARDFAHYLLGTIFEIPSFQRAQDHFFSAIKQGRELERAEAKPGMVWKKWDGSPRKPIDVCNYVWVKNKQGTFISYAKDVAWSSVTHYAIITQPEGSK